MEGLFEVTLEANRGLQQQEVIDTIVTSARQLLRSPQANLTVAQPGGDELAAPMLVAGQPQWLVASGRRRDEPFDDGDRGLLRALGAVGTGALTNAELYQQVQDERERLASITLNIGEGVCALDASGHLIFVNPAAAAMVELPDPGPDGDVAAGPRTSCSGPAREAMRTGRTIREDDARFRGRQGGTIPVAYTASAVMSNQIPAGAVIAFRDITERKAFEDELHHHAFYDSLTGLANRRLLVERLDQALRRSALDRKTHALIFVDVDRFKAINDSLGHVTGDEFLTAIGARMKGVIRGADLLARFGGDEFVVLLEDVAGVDEAIVAARRICSAVEQPMVLPGRVRDGRHRFGRHRADRAGEERGRHAQGRRRRHVRGEGQGRRRHLPGLRSGLDGHPVLRAAADRGRPAQGPRAERARGALPAVLLARRAAHRRRRGAGPLAASGQRPDHAR